MQHTKSTCWNDFDILIKLACQMCQHVADGDTEKRVQGEVLTNIMNQSIEASTMIRSRNSRKSM